MSIEYFQVGGCVRDEILGVKSKDIDYSVVCESYAVMRADILKQGTIFLEKPEFQTIRAKIGKESADFVLARKDGAYSDGRHPDKVEPGTIFDDLARRDFTMNAIAKKADGTLVDPFGGVRDIEEEIIRCVGDTETRFTEDNLRMLRAIRFSVTKGFRMHNDVYSALNDRVLVEGLKRISGDRVREELTKCFKHDTLATLQMFDSFRHLREVVFSCFGNLWLKPTVEE